MAHHIGMSLVALTNALTGAALAAPLPRRPAGALGGAAAARARPAPARAPGAAGRPAPTRRCPTPSWSGRSVRELDTPDTPGAARRAARPAALHRDGEPLRRRATAATRTLAVTRWRADGDPRRHRSVLLPHGRDARPRLVRGATSRSARAADWYRAFLATDRVTFHRGDGDIETRTEIAVVPEDAAEVRRVTVTNNGDARARDRAHQLRRDRARAARRRPGPPGVRQPVRRDRVARLVFGDHRDAPPALGEGADRSGACTWWTPGRSASGR